MQRILIDTPATLSVVFEVNGVATDPSPATATITITRDDGTAIVTGGATTRTAAGTFAYALTAAQNNALDLLTARWTSSLGMLETSVEIVGGFLFTVAQARALSALTSTVTYPTQAIVDARTEVETMLEQACGVAFVPRYTRETVSGNGRTVLQLRPRVTAIRSVSEDDVSVGDVGDILPQPDGAVYYANGWTSGFGNFEVAYEHGWPYPPPMASRAALTWAKHQLVQGPIDDRATSFVTEDGTFSLLTPGIRGSVSGIPFVDSFIQQYSQLAYVG